MKKILQERSNRSDFFRFLFLLAAAFLFIWVNLQVSREVGRLSTVSNYDDVKFLNKAATAYFMAQREGGFSAAAWLFTNYLHAPFSVFSGFLAFTLLGYGVGKAYYSLILVVLSYLFFMAVICRKLPSILWVAMLASSLAIPFASLCATEFRPDLMWAILLSGTGVLWLCSERSFEKVRYGLIFGTGLGLVLLIKPPTFAMSLLVLGGCWILAAGRALITGKTSFRPILASAALALVSAVAVCGWYWMQHFSEIIDYYVINSYGEKKDIWVFRGSLADRWLYYFHGPALQSNLGRAFVPLLLAYLGGCFLEMIRGKSLSARLRGGAMLWMLAGVAVVNGFFDVKSPYLGGSFYGFLIFGAVWYAVLGMERLVLFKSLKIWEQLLAACLLTGLAWGVFEYPVVGKMDPDRARNQAFINRNMLEDLSAVIDKESSMLLTQSNPVVREFLQMELNARGKLLSWESSSAKRTATEAIEMLEGKEFVVVQDQKLIGSPGNAFPSEQWLPQIKVYLDNEESWNLMKEYTLSDGKHVYLYRRQNPIDN